MNHEKEDSRMDNRKKACMFEYSNSLVCVDPSLPFLNLIGKKYTIMIIGILGNSVAKKNFNEILRDIPFSSATIISRRLKELIKSGMVEKFIDEKGLVCYRLTETGTAVREALYPLLLKLEAMA